MSTKLAPGESPKITGVRDQRLTACLVSILVGKNIIIHNRPTGNYGTPTLIFNFFQKK
jgi:hypothetical protein